MTTAVIFPGQGSQSQHMLNDFAQSYPVFNQRVQEASEIVGIDLARVIEENPNGQLNQTAITQPILLTVSMACYEILIAETGLSPVLMAGHSLGEYTALCAAGALDFAEAVALVHQRGLLMQAAVPEGQGAMAAILGLENNCVIEVCAVVDGLVQAANFNAPGQVVIAGEKKSVMMAIELAKEKGAKRAIELPVSVPSHCGLMTTAAAKLSLALDTVHWRMPSVKVIHNVDAQIRHNIDGIKSALGAQLYKPVYWVDCVHKLVEEGVNYCIEVGPANVLTGLNKRIDRTLKTRAFNHPDILSTIQEELDL